MNNRRVAFCHGSTRPVADSRPTKAGDLTEAQALVGLATRLGDEALFGVSKPVERFSGPRKIWR
jgi:hypothetical protein